MKPRRHTPPTLAELWRGLALIPHRVKNNLAEGWYVPGEESSKNRMRLVKYNLTANVTANLIGGNFYTGLLILMDADDASIGLMTILTYAANLFQLFAPLVLERFRRRKPLLIACRSAIHLLNIAFIGLIPFVTGVTQVRMTLMAITVFLVNTISAFSSPGMSIWHIRHVPPRMRVKYFSIVSMLNGVGVAVINLMAAKLVDIFKSSGFELWGITTLRILAMGTAVIEIILLLRLDEHDNPPVRRIHLRDLLTKPWKERIYLKTVAVAFLWSLTANIPGSYYTVYLLRNIGVEYSFITLVSFFNVPVLFLCMPLWRRIFTRFGWLGPLAVGMAALSIHYVGLAFTTENSLFLYPLSVIFSFVCTTGINLAFTSVAYINIPEQNQTLFIGFYSTLSNLGALAGATLGRTFVGWTQGVTATVMGVTMVDKQILILCVGGLMLLAAGLVAFIRLCNARRGEGC